MNWLRSSTDREYDAQHLINEDLRHERRSREDRMVGWRESTPLAEPVPPSLGMDYMARHRKELLQQEVERVRSIWKEYDDELEM
jgi:hypothetical protein